MRGVTRMSDFKLDLQLFADSEPGTTAAEPTTTEPVSDTTPANTQTAAPSEPTSESTHTEPANEPKDGDIMLVTDPRTGRKSIVTKEAEPAEHTEPTEQTNTEQTPNDTQVHAPAAEEKPAKPLINTGAYTLDELNDAIRQNTVNESRIPTEYQFQYQQYRQQQAQKQAQMQAQQQQLEEQQKQAALEKQRKLYADIDDAAKKKAMQDLGITADDLSLSEYSDDEETKKKVQEYTTAVAWNKQALINAMQQQQMNEQGKLAQQRAIYQSITDFAADKQKSEPHFTEINQMLSTHYQELPYKEAATIAGAIDALNKGNITEQQCKVLEQYYEDTRTYFYGKQNDLTKQPKKIPVPNVEKPGMGAQTKPQAVDFTKMRSMGDRERRAFMSRYFNN